MGSMMKKLGHKRPEKCQSCETGKPVGRMRVRSKSTNYSDRVWLCARCAQRIVDNTKATN